MNVGVREGEEVVSGVCETVTGRGVSVGVGWFDGEQAESPVRSVSRNQISFVA